MRLLVCGGRDFKDTAWAVGILDAIHDELEVDTLIEGGAYGADKIARTWATEKGIRVDTYHAEWDALGIAAGPMRNQRMISEGHPDLVVAFPGGKGTIDMIRRACRARIPVRGVCFDGAWTTEPERKRA